MSKIEPGWWLLATTVLYTVAALINVWWPYAPLVWIQVVWLFTMMAPMWMGLLHRLITRWRG